MPVDVGALTPAGTSSGQVRISTFSYTVICSGAFELRAPDLEIVSRLECLDSNLDTLATEFLQLACRRVSTGPNTRSGRRPAHDDICPHKLYDKGNIRYMLTTNS